MLTKCYAVEYGHKGIRANAICPGQIMADLQRKRYAAEASQNSISFEERVGLARESIPLDRIGTVEDVGRMVAFLVSEQSSYLTGQALNICGGQLVEI